MNGYPIRLDLHNDYYTMDTVFLTTESKGSMVESLHLPLAHRVHDILAFWMHSDASM